MNNNDQKNNKILELANQLSELTFNEQLLLVSTLEKECGYTMPATGTLDSEKNEEEVISEEQPTAFKIMLNKIPLDVPTKFSLAKFLSSTMAIDLVGARNALSKLPLIVKENLTFTKEELESIQSLYKSDIRSMINYIQSNQYSRRDKKIIKS